jgi:hypothetical protein
VMRLQRGLFRHEGKARNRNRSRHTWYEPFPSNT